MLAFVVPGVIVILNLNSFNDTESEAHLQAFTRAQYAIEWLQAHCGEEISALLNGSYDPQEPISCSNYPNGVDQPQPDAAVPNMSMRVDISAVPDEEGNLSLAQVKVTVTWQRTFIVRAEGRRVLAGYLFGNPDEYWEFYPDWSA